MNPSGSTRNDDIDRLVQQAEFYETQGLYEQAVQVYRDILTKQPDHEKARSRIAVIERSQEAQNTSGPVVTRPDSLSPRLALDLGLAYMGMNLYAEAIEEFTHSLKTSPAVRPDLLRYTLACLVHLGKHERATKAMHQLLDDPSLTLAEKGDIVADTAALYLEKGQVERASTLLQGLTDQQKMFVRDYDKLLAQVSQLDEEDLEIEVEDPETGIVYSEPLMKQGRTRAATKDEPQRRKKPELPSVPLKTAVAYSLDSRNWHNGTSESVSPQWAVLQLDEQLNTGDSLVVRFRLPVEDENDTISVISRVAEPPLRERNHHRVRVQFLSFLPGGESTLNAFIERAVENPAVLQDAAHMELIPGLSELPPDEPKQTPRRIGAQAVKKAIRQAPPEDDDAPAEGALALMAKLDAEGIARVHFACECGQVHVVPAKNAGRKGKCATCGNVLTVPMVDTRPDSLSDRVIGKVVGGCRLLCKLGGGGMGGVFKGHHIALDIPVAVKILHAHLAEKDPVFIKRFIREARAAARLQHPNIVGVMNVGFENGLHYLVMPFVSGGSAAALLAKKGRLPVDTVLDIAVEMARALVVAEENNLLHRDIKPANILFNEKGSAKLADLGLAKSFLEGQDVSITQTGIACGTPLYFSPEQAKGARNLDIRSDIYSLGITLYHLINGSPPYKGESAYVIFQKHVHEPLPPFDDDVPPVPAAVVDLLVKMTAKNPDNRYSSAEELLSAIESVQAEIKGDPNGPSSSGAPKKGLLARLGLKRFEEPEK
ncbi:MAG: protein kinase [Thermodesulfobacteriota bacterium]